MDTAFAQNRAPNWVAWEPTPEPPAERRATGLYDGTLIATVSGWRRVENLRPGDQVLTLDCGPVRLLARVEVTVPERAASPDQWPRLVPAGVLGNRGPMRLQPDQGVLVESACAEALCGDRFALLPVRALDGFRGIAPLPHPPQARVWQLRFAESQVLCVEGEALVFCPSHKPRRMGSDRSVEKTRTAISACGRSAVPTAAEAPSYQPLSAAATVVLLRQLASATV